MSAILDAVAAERELLVARLATLDEIERLARELDGQPAKPAPRSKAGSNGSKPTEQIARDLGLPPLRSRPQQAPARPASPSEIARRQAEVLALVKELEPVAFSTLLDRVDMPARVLTNSLAALRERRLVRSTGNSRGARWHLTATLDRQIAMRSRRSPQAKVDVLQTIRNEPGKWSEQRIAATGAWDREDVADACGELLADGVVELLPDGTYAPCEAVAA